MKQLRILPVLLFVTCILSSHVWALGQETFGEGPVVYHTWVNGNEHFYYQGGTDILDEALLKFAATEANAHEVIIRPGPAIIRTFDKTQQIRHDWLCHTQGRFTRYGAESEQGTNVFDKNPTITIFIGEGMISWRRSRYPKGLRFYNYRI